MPQKHTFTQQEECPVCGATIAPGQGVTAVHDAQTYHLCSERCRAAFVADPGKYVGNVAS